MQNAVHMRPQRRAPFNTARHASTHKGAQHHVYGAMPCLTQPVALPHELTWQHALELAHDRYWRQDR